MEAKWTTRKSFTCPSRPIIAGQEVRSEQIGSCTVQASGAREATLLRPRQGAGRRGRAFRNTVTGRNTGVEGVVRAHVKVRPR